MSPPPIARLRQGTYSGTVLQTTFGGGNTLPRPVEAFLGVPYSRVSVAEGGRFREAGPVTSNGGSGPDETIRATGYGPVCPTTTREEDEGQGRTVEEDCLNANVFRPAGASPRGGGSPVVVFFHGGCFNFGSSADRDMAGFVAHAAFPIVAVSFNYRLGPLGFLSCGAAEKEGVLNLGLRDQRRLLAWVAENIAAFGGDADNVTLMGVSAGAHSIGHHILSSGSSHPSEKPLFRKAILESGSPNARSVLSPPHPRHELQLRQFLAGCFLSEDLPDAQLFPSLRSLPLSTILKASASVWASHSSSLCWPFQPAIDGPGGVVPDMPMKLACSSFSSAEARSSSPVPLITGFNSHEGTLFVPADAHTNADFRRFFQTLIPSFTDADLDALETLYPESSPAASGHSTSYYSLGIPRGYGAQFPRIASAYAHQAYIAPVLHTAHHASRSRSAGGRVCGGPVYVYEFAARADEDLKAANHGDESALVVRDVDQLGAHPGLMRTSKRMHGLFTQFVASRAGDPNETLSMETGATSFSTCRGKGDSLTWPEFLSPFTEDAPPGAGQILVFGEGNDERCGGKAQGCVAGVRTLTALEMRQCRFWWERMDLCQGIGVRDASPRAEKCRSSL